MLREPSIRVETQIVVKSIYNLRVVLLLREKVLTESSLLHDCIHYTAHYNSYRMVENLTT